MQFTTRNSEAIRAGDVSVTFRNWRRPHAKVGGVYRLRPDGAIRVTGVRAVRLSEVSAADAARAGFEDVAALARFLKLPATAEVTRVDFQLTDEAALRRPPVLTAEEALARLAATDRRSGTPWTAAVLALIAAHPATLAAKLAVALGWETPRLKANVRKLKALGLTESLQTGYRLTELGARVTGRLADRK